MSDDLSGKAVLIVTVGPVQPFIAAARTVRDLWSGSTLLSYLVFRGMGPVLEHVVFPRLKRHDRFATGDDHRFTAGDDHRSPCVPNRFVALVPAADAEAKKAACVAAVREAWKEIADAVRTRLEAEWDRNDPAWAGRWDQQIEGYFEVRATAVPCAEAAAAPGVKPGYSGVMAFAEKVAGAAKAVRHFPSDSPDGGGREPVPEKCSLLGTFEQIGPGGFRETRQFWKRLHDEEAAGQGTVIDGVRLNSRDAFCAVALAKRFCGPAFFAKKLTTKPADLRFDDTPTIAAARWLDLPGVGIRPAEVRGKYGNWNGLWLHWSSRVQDLESAPACPAAVHERIRAARSDHGWPPSYYAVLMMDGDNMGERLRGCDRQGHADFSEALAGFAADPAPRIVKDFNGTPVYAGGDDVLALLPADAALKCADALRQRFEQDVKATMSAGIAVVHYKEDLRFALEAARRAEKDAKGGGRNAAVLTVCRRSGEHGSARMPWACILQTTTLINEFAAGKSDRWAYHLRADGDTLRHLPPEAVEAEVRRRVGRAERPPLSPDEAAAFYRGYRAAVKQPDADSLPGFLALCLAASFLARGGDE